MKTFKVIGSYTVTRYVERIVKAESVAEAEHQAWCEVYEAEVDTGEDRGEFEITEETVEVK